MTQTICRMYSNLAQAEKAVEDLKRKNYQHVHLITGTVSGDSESGAGNVSYDSILSAIMKAHIWKKHASVYADRVSRGNTLITVHAPFGTARDAIATMAKYDPIDSGVPDVKFDAPVWNESTPMSCALQMPVLMKTRLPFAKVWNVPSISAKPTPMSTLCHMLPLAKPATSFSSKIGMPLLANSAPSFSAKFGLPLLSNASKSTRVPQRPR
jgi:hypothetical protein